MVIQVFWRRFAPPKHLEYSFPLPACGEGPGVGLFGQGFTKALRRLAAASREWDFRFPQAALPLVRTLKFPLPGDQRVSLLSGFRACQGGFRGCQRRSFRLGLQPEQEAQQVDPAHQ